MPETRRHTETHVVASIGVAPPILTPAPCAAMCRMYVCDKNSPTAMPRLPGG